MKRENSARQRNVFGNTIDRTGLNKCRISAGKCKMRLQPEDKPKNSNIAKLKLSITQHTNSSSKH